MIQGRGGGERHAWGSWGRRSGGPDDGAVGEVQGGAEGVRGQGGGVEGVEGLGHALAVVEEDVGEEVDDRPVRQGHHAL